MNSEIRLQVYCPIYLTLIEWSVCTEANMLEQQEKDRPQTWKMIDCIEIYEVYSKSNKIMRNHDTCN